MKGGSLLPRKKTSIYIQPAKERNKLSAPEMSTRGGSFIPDQAALILMVYSSQEMKKLSLL